MSVGLKWFLGIIGTLVLAIILLFVALRSHDGPMEILTGGPFTSGELVTNVTDWQFLDEFSTIELQTMRPPRARVMWLVVHEGRVYVLSSYMNTAIGKFWKQWPRRVAKDNRAIVRADDKLYEFKLERLLEGDHIPAIINYFNENITLTTHRMS